MKTHAIKLLPDFFDAVADGRKTFELRYNDRGYAVGDELILVEHGYQGEDLQLLPTGRSLRRKISYMLTGPIYGLAQGHSILAFAQPEQAAQDSRAPISKRGVFEIHDALEEIEVVLGWDRSAASIKAMVLEKVARIRDIIGIRAARASGQEGSS